MFNCVLCHEIRTSKVQLNGKNTAKKHPNKNKQNKKKKKRQKKKKMDESNKTGVPVV